MVLAAAGAETVAVAAVAVTGLVPHAAALDGAAAKKRREGVPGALPLAGVPIAVVAAAAAGRFVEAAAVIPKFAQGGASPDGLVPLGAPLAAEVQAAAAA